LHGPAWPNSLNQGRVDRYGTGGTRLPNIWTRETVTSVPPLFKSQVKSSCLCLLISSHFILQKHLFYFNVDKEASASGGDFVPQTPTDPTRALSLDPAGTSQDSLLRPPNYGDRSTPMTMLQQMRNNGSETADNLSHLSPRPPDWLSPSSTRALGRSDRTAA